MIARNPILPFARLIAGASIALSAALVGAQDQPAQEPQAQEAPSPRSIDDIIKVLDQYKPDIARIEKARATLKLATPETEDRAELVRHYYARWSAANTLGDLTEGIASLRKAREFMDQGDRNYGVLLRNIASAEWRGGNPANASQAIREASKLAQGNQVGQLIISEALSSGMNAFLGDFDVARSSLRTAEGTYTKVSRAPAMQLWQHFMLSYIERGRAEMFLAEGKLVEAEAAYRKVLRELEADLPDQKARAAKGLLQPSDESNQGTRAFVLRRLASVLRSIGRLGEAEINIRAALKITLEQGGRFSSDTVGNMQTFAFILLEQGRFAEASLMSREALKSLAGGGVPPQSLSAIGARKALGAALVANSEWDEAIQSYEALRASIADDAQLVARFASGDLDWAHALLKKNRAADAKTMLEPMLAASAKTFGDQHAATAQIRGFYAVSLNKSGARPQAMAEFAKAVPVIIEQARNDSAADSGSVRQARRLTLILENYIDLLAQMKNAGLPTPGIDPVAESFRLADIARGSEVQRAMAASAARTTISDPALADLARREQDAQRRINALSDILQTLLAAPPAQQLPSVIAQMRKDVEGLTKERIDLKAQIEKRFPDYAELIDPKPVSIAQVQSALRTGETLISIYLGEDASFVWAVPKSGAVVMSGAPLTMTQVGKTVEHLRKALDPSADSINNIPAFDLAVAGKLYEQLLKPVESAWKGSSQSLLIVPHGPLGQLPFAVLPTSMAPLAAKSALPFEEYKTVPWLLRQATLTQLPSVTALTTLRKTPAPRGERRMYLGIGDPFFSKAQEREFQQESAVKVAVASASTTRGVPVRLRSAPKTDNVSSAELSLLPRLPDTEDELMEIGKTLGADMGKDVILHKNANEVTVKTMNLADRRIIHFATHGLVPGELNGLTQPALALTAPDVAGVEGDGLLTMDEILALKLNADWVVLSACNTASGDGAGHEAVSGLGRAFFYAGARALLVSNWPVDSVAARLLMTDLFKRYAAGAPTAKADSLRFAMLDLMDGPGSVVPSTGKSEYAYAHPLFWAPFVLVGD